MRTMDNGTTSIWPADMAPPRRPKMSPRRATNQRAAMLDEVAMPSPPEPMAMSTPALAVELPEMSHERGEHGADAEDGGGEEHHAPRAPRVGEPAHCGPDRTQHEEGQCRRARELLTSPPELGLDGLDEDAEDRADARAGQHHEDHGDEQDPAVVEGAAHPDHGASLGRLHSLLEMSGPRAGIRQAAGMRPA